MKAAIYARKSNEQNVADDAKSVTRQIELSRAFAERNGWLLADEHIFADDGIGGGEFQERDGLNRLLAACGVAFSKADRRAKARPPFDVLIAMDESRLGREQIETSYLVKKITERGVRLFSYKTGAERTIGNATDKVILGLTNFAFEMEREQAILRGKES